MADISQLWQLVKDAASNESSKWGNSPRLADLLMRDKSTQGIRDYAGNVQQRGTALAGLLQGREPTGAQKALFSGLDPTTDEGAMNLAMGIGPGMIKTPFGRIPENYADTKKLADMIERAGKSKGYIVTREGSGVSPSQYVAFGKAGDKTGDLTRQLRISNHADKYPELASGIRTSVDPNTGVTYEQAINWLAREGFPTNLSTRFSKIPSTSQAAEEAINPSSAQRLQKAIDAWLNKPKATRGPRPE